MLMFTNRCAKVVLDGEIFNGSVDLILYSSPNLSSERVSLIAGVKYGME